MRTLLFISLFLLSLNSLANEEIQLDVMSVEATKDDLMASDFQVFQRDDFINRFQNLSNFLQQQNGLQVQQAGGLGNPALISIRGANSSQTTLLINGIKANNSQFGGYDLNTIPLNQKKLPTTLSFKAGLMFSNVVLYQVNFADKVNTSTTKSFYNYDVDKRQYNTAQLGYAAGLDLDAFVSKRISINASILNSAVSQVVNFPTFRGDRSRPIQVSSSFSVGTKFRF